MNTDSQRLAQVQSGLLRVFGRANAVCFSAPGRTEIAGNHTDHQGGRVLAAAVGQELLAAAAPNLSSALRVFSEGYAPFELDLRSLLPGDGERGSSAALCRGVAAGLRQLGRPLGGFDVYLSSRIPAGAGLSSSAAFEVLIGLIFDVLFADGRLPALTLARVAQSAERDYFGKPCGLMDEAACALGGLSLLDFAPAGDPAVRALEFAPKKAGYALCLLLPGGSHAGLTSEYAAIPAEMGSVAAMFGKQRLGELSPAEFEAALPKLRGFVSDRALLRALHFFEENERVLAQAAALEAGDFPAFLALVRSSGQSSLLQLQNIYPSADISERGLALALALCRKYLSDCGGAWRVHGGGFAGTVQVYCPLERLQTFTESIESVLGAGSLLELEIQPLGARAL